MRDQRAQQILRSLVNGADPFTGEDLSPSTVLQQADVIRAMLAGCSALEERTARASRRAQLPKNAGRAWTTEEQERLVQAFHAGESWEEIAARHGRSLRGIESRLETLGLITEEQRTTEKRFEANPSDEMRESQGSRPRGRPAKRRS